jgi:hypothetical protein
MGKGEQLHGSIATAGPIISTAFGGMINMEQTPQPQRDEKDFERFLAHQLQGVDPVTGEIRPSAKEIAKYKERKATHEFRVFLALGVPVGFVVAMAIGLSTNLGNSGFFCCWAVCSFVAGAVINSMVGMKKPPE